MPELLREIYAARAAQLRGEMARESLPELLSRAQEEAPRRRSLARALRSAPPPAVIAEFKRASPSAGSISSLAEAGPAARRYQAAGASALSVLTEADHFHGRLEDLQEARRASSLPVLRKDFLTTTYQLAQSAAHGADAVLAIVRGLSDGQLRALLEQARPLRLEVLVEVHSELELERALRCGAELIGVNNRDLETLLVDPSLTLRLLPLVPKGVLVVSESGFRTPEQVAELHRAGVAAFLVGEALMRSEDPIRWLAAARGKVLEAGSA